MQANQSDNGTLLAERIADIAKRHTQRDPVECLENGESCAGETTMGLALEELDRLIVDIFTEHQAETPQLPAPYVEDSLLEHMARYHTTENAVQFVQSRWTCANERDVVAALKELREVHTARYNEQAALENRPGVANPDEEEQAPPAPTTKPQGWQPYATAPKDGTLVDLFTQADGGRRIVCVRYVLAREVDPKYGPGGCWEHLAQDGWRQSILDPAVLVDTGFTHWRLVETDRPKGA